MFRLQSYYIYTMTVERPNFYFWILFLIYYFCEPVIKGILYQKRNGKLFLFRDPGRDQTSTYIKHIQV